jgi:4'-phosphopantetheinyl transferase
MNRDGIADPSYPDVPAAPGRDEAHVWRVRLPHVERREAARRALREILGGYLGEEPEAVALAVGEAGKPRLAAAAAALSFNLSHSGGLALVAVAAGGVEIGIDVELIRPRRDLVRLAARWLPAADATAVAAAPEEEREDVFYAAWTRFEARAKCTGTGLSGPPPGPEVVALPLEIDRGYAAALATVGTAPTTVHRLDFARLDARPHG